MKQLIKTSVIGVSLLLCACGGHIVSSKAFVVPPEEPLRTIALLSIDEPKSYTAEDQTSLALAFGAVGGAVAGASTASATERLTIELRGQGYQFSADMHAALIRHLQQRGFHVTAMQVTRDTPQRLLSDYAKVSAPRADAILDVAAISVGYLKSRGTERPGFCPRLWLVVRLVSVKTKETLYADTIQVHEKNFLIGGAKLPAPEVCYNDFAAVIADAAKSAKGLQAASDSAAKYIAAQLRKQ